MEEKTVEVLLSNIDQSLRGMLNLAIENRDRQKANSERLQWYFSDGYWFAPCITGFVAGVIATCFLRG